MNREIFSKNPIFKILIGSFSGFINGLFGGGSGMIIVPALIHILKLKDKTSHATTMKIVLPLSITSTIFYFIRIKTPFDKTLYLSIGSGVLIGGIIGSFLLKKIDNRILRMIFSIVVVLCGIIQLSHYL